MNEYTLTIRLTDDQQRQLAAITEAINQQRDGEQMDVATTFNMIMQTGIAHVIDDRLGMWGEQFGLRRPGTKRQ